MKTILFGLTLLLLTACSGDEQTQELTEDTLNNQDNEEFVDSDFPLIEDESAQGDLNIEQEPEDELDGSNQQDFDEGDQEEPEVSDEIDEPEVSNPEVPLEMKTSPQTRLS